MKILDKLLKLQDIVKKDNAIGHPPEPPQALSLKLSNAAVAAITNGIKSPEWRQYMSLFADNAQQLERLTVPKVGEPKYLRLMRAYIVSNAVCDAGTNAHTANKIDVLIDQGLNDVPDNTVANTRPFVIPGLQ